MLDHHFTERQTGHVHIYQIGLPVQHLHSYAIPHAHGEAKDVLHGLDDTGPQSGIIFLPADGEGMIGASGLTFTAASLTAAIVFVIPSILMQVFLMGQKALYPIISVAEPPPPRLAF